MWSYIFLLFTFVHFLFHFDLLEEKLSKSNDILYLHHEEMSITTLSSVSARYLLQSLVVPSHFACQVALYLCSLLYHSKIMYKCPCKLKFQPTTWHERIYMFTEYTTSINIMYKVSYLLFELLEIICILWQCFHVWRWRTKTL